MGIETYVLIAVCYATGCYLSYKLGLRRGKVDMAKTIVTALANLMQKQPNEVAGLLIKQIDKQLQALKSKGA